MLYVHISSMLDVKIARAGFVVHDHVAAVFRLAATDGPSEARASKVGERARAQRLRSGRRRENLRRVELERLRRGRLCGSTTRWARAHLRRRS